MDLLKLIKVTILVLALIVSHAASAVGQGFALEERQEIARRITEAMQYIRVDTVETPLVEGFVPKAIFWIRNNEENGYTTTFRSGDYTIAINDPTETGVGPYLCEAAREFDYQSMRLEPRFLRDTELSAELGAEADLKGGKISIGFSIDGLEGLVRETFASLRGLGNWMLGKEDTKFLVLVRGHADAGHSFTRALLPPPYDYYMVRALPPDPTDLSGLNFYMKEEMSHNIPDPYRNEDLPLLRARFFQQLINVFASNCVAASFETRVLEGSTVNRVAPDELRKVDLFLYAY